MVDRKIKGLEVAGSSLVTITFLPLNPQRLHFSRRLFAENQTPALLPFNIFTINKLIIIYFMTLPTQRFSISAFKKALTTTTNLQAILKTLQNAFHKYQFQKTFLAIQKLHQVCQQSYQSNVPLNNCLQAVYAIIQTASVLGLTLLEIFLLPQLIQMKKKLINKQKLILKRSNNKIQVPLSKSLLQNQIRNKSLRLLFQSIFLAAAIKPYLNIFSEQLQEDSLFKRALSYFTQEEFQSDQSISRKVTQKLRNSYLSSLKSFNFSHFVNFIQNKFTSFIQSQDKMDSFYEKAIITQQIAFSTAIIHACMKKLLQFPTQTQANACLDTLFSYTKKSNVYLLLISNSTTILKTLYHQLIENTGSKKQRTSKQKLVFQQIQKKFTNLVKTCAICDLFNWQELNESMKLIQIIQGSQNSLKLHQDSQRIKQNSLNINNQQKFKRTIQIIKSETKLFRLVQNISEHIILSSLGVYSKNKSSNIIDSKHKDESQQLNGIIKQLFAEVQECLKSLKLGQNIQENINNLKQFVNQWRQLNIEKDNSNQQILRDGDALIQKICLVNKLYVQLKEKELDLKTFKQKIMQVLQQKSITERYGKFVQSSLAPKSRFLSQTKNQNQIIVPQINQKQISSSKQPNQKILKRQKIISNEKIIDEIPITLTQKDKSQQIKKKKQYKVIEQSIIETFGQYSVEQQSQSKAKQQQYKQAKRSVLKFKKKDTQQSVDKVFNKIANLSTDFTNVTNNKQITKPYGKVCEAYQLNNTTWLNLSKDTQKQNFSRDLGQTYLLKRLQIQKMNYAKTSKSIESYRNSINRSTSRNSRLILSKSKEKSRSIIKRQYQNLKLKQKEQKGYELASRNLKSGQGSNSVNFTSSLNQHKNQTQNCSTQLFIDKSFEYFPQKSSKLKRGCLKSKGLLHDSNQLQIGYVHFKKGYDLDFTLFITAKVNINYMQFNIESNQSLRTHLEFQKIQKMQAGKQWSLKIETSLQKMPFCMPKLTLLFKQLKPPQKQEKIVLLLPCSINKYLDFDCRYNKAQLSLYQQQNGFYRTYYFKLTKKLTNPETMSKLLAFFKPIKVREKLCNFRTECSFYSGIYVLDLVQQEKQAWYLIGRQIKGQQKHLEYILHSFFFILSE